MVSQPALLDHDCRERRRGGVMPVGDRQLEKAISRFFRNETELPTHAFVLGEIEVQCPAKGLRAKCFTQAGVHVRAIPRADTKLGAGGPLVCFQERSVGRVVLSC